MLRPLGDPIKPHEKILSLQLFLSHLINVFITSPPDWVYAQNNDGLDAFRFDCSCLRYGLNEIAPKSILSGVPFHRLRRNLTKKTVIFVQQYTATTLTNCMPKLFPIPKPACLKVAMTNVRPIKF